LIVGDGLLINGIPFAALPQHSSKSGFLGSLHTIRSLPSELLLLDSQQSHPTNGFVGVADPIYNFADVRLVPTSRIASATRGEKVVLARLVGSGQEIKTAADQSGTSPVRLLTGSDASIAQLRNALTQSPAILHFAVHVVSPPQHQEDAALALSLGPSNLPELLTKETIRSLRVPGSLVVLSGCSSSQGQTLPSAGVLGLSRAWLLAGASAVLVSAWPTPDDSGEVVASFDRHMQQLNAGSSAMRAATALQQAQLDMQQSPGYRSKPSFWAAFSLISKE
jgi:CHAT domain-containing protein